MVHDVSFHMVLEAIGAGVTYYAYNYCSHWRHRLLIWFGLALVFSIITVELVG